jgi:hypothetical protein
MKVEAMMLEFALRSLAEETFDVSLYMHTVSVFECVIGDERS